MTEPQCRKCKAILVGKEKFGVFCAPCTDAYTASTKAKAVGTMVEFTFNGEELSALRKFSDQRMEDGIARRLKRRLGRDVELWYIGKLDTETIYSAKWFDGNVFHEDEVRIQERQHSRIPSFTCPQCGYVMDAATPVKGRGVPQEGNLSICAKCGQLLMYNADLSQRKLTIPELRDVMASSAWRTIERAQTLIRSQNKNA